MDVRGRDRTRCSVWASLVCSASKRLTDMRAAFISLSEAWQQSGVCVAMPPPRCISLLFIFPVTPATPTGVLKVCLNPTLHRPPADVLHPNVAAAAGDTSHSPQSLEGTTDPFFSPAESVKAYLHQTSLRWVMSPRVVQCTASRLI